MTLPHPVIRAPAGHAAGWMNGSPLSSRIAPHLISLMRLISPGECRGSSRPAASSPGKCRVSGRGGSSHRKVKQYGDDDEEASCKFRNSGIGSGGIRCDCAGAGTIAQAQKLEALAKQLNLTPEQKTKLMPILAADNQAGGDQKQQFAGTRLQKMEQLKASSRTE